MSVPMTRYTSSILFVLLSFLICAIQGRAQQGHQMELDVPTSYFELSGLSYIGNIVGDPGWCNMGGDVGISLDPPSGPFLGGKFENGVFHTVPNILYAEIPNIFSWLPPLCEIEMQDAAFELRSLPFPISTNGDFQATVELWPMDGYLAVTPLLSQTTTYSLVQYGPSDPTPVTGSVTASQGTTTLDMLINVSHGFDDPAQGMWAYITFDGTLYGQTPTQASLYNLTVGNLVAGQTATFSVDSADQQRPVWLAYGFQTGQSWITPLGVYLGLQNPKQAGNRLVTDSSGSAQWTLPIPSHASGVTVFMQSCQIGWVSQVVAVTIQ